VINLARRFHTSGEGARPPTNGGALPSSAGGRLRRTDSDSGALLSPSGGVWPIDGGRMPSASGGGSRATTGNGGRPPTGAAPGRLLTDSGARPGIGSRSQTSNGSRGPSDSGPSEGGWRPPAGGVALPAVGEMNGRLLRVATARNDELAEQVGGVLGRVQGC
jgi:hypothetical protein